jgi:IS5 family transposase
LDQIINLEHPRVILSQRLDWSAFEQDFGATYHDSDGRPGAPIRVFVGLHYLKHTCDESDESIIHRFVENPYWQYFCGFEYFQPSFPIDPSSKARFRKRIGWQKLEHLLKELRSIAIRERYLNERDLEHHNVDLSGGQMGNTVQGKHSKNKLYSIHAPEVECISKGKAHKRYEFGCKVSLATTSKKNCRGFT